MLYNQSISQRKEASVAAAVLACVESSACIPAQSFSLVLEASGSNSGARQDVPFEGLDATDIESEADLHKALELYACGSRASGVQASQHAQQVYATQELFCSLPDAEPASQTVSASQRRRQVPTLASRAPHDLGACAYTATEAAALHWLQGCSTSQSLGPALRSPGPQNSLSGQSFALAAGALVGAPASVSSSARPSEDRSSNSRLPLAQAELSAGERAEPRAGQPVLRKILLGRKRKPTEAEVQERQRRKRVCFNIFDAMNGEDEAVQAALVGFRVPRHLYEKLRAKYCDFYKREDEQEAESMSQRDFRAQARAHFAKAGRTLRMKLLKEMLEDQDALSEHWAAIEMMLGQEFYKSKPRLQKDSRKKGSRFMFICNSEAWCVPELALEEGKSHGRRSPWRRQLVSQR